MLLAGIQAKKLSCQHASSWHPSNLANFYGCQLEARWHDKASAQMPRMTVHNR